MSPLKRVLFYACILAASFILLNSIIFLMHAVYRPPAWITMCETAPPGMCQNMGNQFYIDISSVYRANLQGSFYLIAILTICFGPFLSRRDLFPTLLYSFGGMAAFFAFYALRKNWFFEIGSDTPDAISSILLFLICLGGSYLLYKRAEAVLDSCYAIPADAGRAPLVKKRTAQKKMA
ncbi:MAG: hypothetical protein WC477_00795 [Patescibacteria group bacterium]